MKIKWLGHACFAIETGNKRIITDPFNEEVGYPMPGLSADIITVSHEHWDHSAVDTISGHPEVINQTGEYRLGPINITGLPSFHDKTGGQERGKNIIFCIQAEGIKVVHLGDLGHVVAEQLSGIGGVDILLIPVGGKYTIDAQEAFVTVQNLNPGIVVPMHYQTPHLSFELAPVELFSAQFDQVVKKPYLEINPKDLGKDKKVIILDYMS